MLRRARLKSGDTLLVVGIGSGVSCAALALGTTIGARVEVTSRSEQKQAQALEMGAAAAHDSAASKWAVEADVVVESVGPATWDQSVRALKPGGRMVVCGSTSGPKVELTLPRLFFKQFEIIGSTMGSYQEFDEVLEMVDNGLPITIDQSFPVESYPEALARLEHGEQLGKIVLTHEGG
jgi:zinc-binding alcohol dehydrogenase/oxidoreductase